MLTMNPLEEAVFYLNTQLKNLYVHLETELNEGLYIVLSREKETPVSCASLLYGCPNNQALKARSFTKILGQSKARLLYKSLLPPSQFAGRRPSFEQRLSQPLLALIRKIAANKSVQTASSVSASYLNSTCKRGFSTRQSLDSFYESLGKTDAARESFVCGHPLKANITSGNWSGHDNVRNPFFDTESPFEHSSAGSFLPEQGGFITYQLTEWIEQKSPDSAFELTESEAHLFAKTLRIRLY